jgi:purine-binding chemotaxis protein CheW
VTEPGVVAEEQPAAREAVVIQLGPSRFAVPIGSIAEVARPLPVTRVPGLPGWAAGVVNWRGRILAVIDLREILGAQRTDPAGASRLVVLAHDGLVAGLVADAVAGTVDVPAAVEDAPATLAPDAAAIVGAGFTDATGPVAVLDVAAVFRLREELPRRTA